MPKRAGRDKVASPVSSSVALLREQARAALKGAAREKSGALAAAMEARDAARARLAAVEGAAESERAQAERDLTAARKRTEELGDALQAAQVPCRWLPCASFVPLSRAPHTSIWEDLISECMTEFKRTLDIGLDHALCLRHWWLTLL